MRYSAMINRNTCKRINLSLLRNMISMLLIGMALFSWMGQAQAHAVLTHTLPAANAKLEESPKSVEIVFNEKLDSGGAKLLVLNDLSHNVAKDKPTSIEEGKGLSLALPKLVEGHYTVSYSVISADGHPISGAFIFTVGNPERAPGASQLDPHQQVGHANHGSEGMSVQTFLLYAARILYYAGLLAIAGLALWSLLLRRQALPTPIHNLQNQALALAGKFTFIATLTYLFFSLQDLAQGEELSEWGRILLDTTIGKLYLSSLLLSLVAVWLWKLGSILRFIWVILSLFVEAWSGHAAALEPFVYMVGLDWLHLAAASLWSAGLVLLLAIWYKERSEAGRFALIFSKWALFSFLLLWITGVLATLRYLPTLDYLFYTTWGKWLIAKAGISLLVVVTAFLIRKRMRRGDMPSGSLLKVDVGLLAAIVLTVGILTYQSPLPANQPINFHKMGTEMHVTLRVSPNTPGDNQFLVKIWLPDTIGQGVPKRVQLRLLPQNREDMGYIDVPLEAYTDEERDGFPDFAKTTYRAEGPFLPFAGQWKYQIRVTDSLDNERVVETEERIY